MSEKVNMFHPVITRWQHCAVPLPHLSDVRTIIDHKVAVLSLQLHACLLLIIICSMHSTCGVKAKI